MDSEPARYGVDKSRRGAQGPCFVTSEVAFGRTELSLRRIAPASWCSIEWAWSRGLIPSKNRKTPLFLIFHVLPFAVFVDN